MKYIVCIPPLTKRKYICTVSILDSEQVHFKCEIFRIYLHGNDSSCGEIFLYAIQNCINHSKSVHVLGLWKRFMQEKQYLIKFLIWLTLWYVKIVITFCHEKILNNFRKIECIMKCVIRMLITSIRRILRWKHYLYCEKKSSIKLQCDGSVVFTFRCICQHNHILLFLSFLR